MSSHEDLNKPLRLVPTVSIKTSQSAPANTAPVSSEIKKNKSPKAEEIYAGQHFIVDFWGQNFLTDAKVIEQSLLDAANIAGATVLHIHLHKFSNAGGVTGVALLAESHISVHTWPENNFAAFDIFMCGEAKPEKAVDLLRKVFQPDKVEITKLFRGKI